MKKSLYIPVKTILLLALLLMASCNEDDQHVLFLLEKAETVMEEYPDSAYRLLCEADSGIAEQSKGTRIRHFLLKTEADNKLYHPLPSDTLFQEVVDYYDDHGTSNQQLMAHYLLGCIYRDQSEAPMALQCYNDAVEKADTTSNECDYTLLYKVYGQMADVYGKQLMPEEALEAEEKYSHYALQAKDTFNYIKGIELSSVFYLSMCDTPNVFRSTFESARLYKKHGYPQEAANVYHEVIDIYLGTAQYEKAHELMQICENESGLFDENGEPQKKSYYYNKGRYYAGVNMLDSAELCFRKLLNAGYEYYAYKGLLSCYLKRRDTDSIVKYSSLCEDGLMHFLSQNQIDKVVVASSLYDYSRHQTKALQEAKTSERRLFIIIGFGILFLLFLCAAGIVLYLYTRRREKKTEQTHRIRILAADLSERFIRTRDELDMMENNFTALNELKEKKEQELIDLQEQLREIQNKYGHILKDDFSSLLQSPFVVAIRKKTEIPGRIKPLTDEDKRELVKEFQHYMPQLYARLANTNKLSKLEFFVVLLTRIGLQPDVITQLLDVASNSTSNARKKANNKLFADDTAYTLFDNLSRL